MTLAHILVILGALAIALGSSVYIWKTLTGKVQPNRVSWFLWAFATLIAAAVAYVEGARWTVLPVFMAGFCPFLIFLASFANAKAYWKLEKFDWLCGVFSLAALAVWILVDQPELAVLFAIIADALACLPTLKKAWTHPHTESISGFTGSLFNALTVFFVIEIGSFTELAFPVYLVFANVALILVIYLRGQRAKPPAAAAQ